MCCPTSRGITRASRGELVPLRVFVCRAGQSGDRRTPESSGEVILITPVICSLHGVVGECTSFR